MSEDVFIKGKVRIIAKTGGFKLEDRDEWFNPPKNSDLGLNVGDSVSFTVEGGLVQGLTKDVPKSFVLSRERVIIRQNVLNRAVECWIAGKASSLAGALSLAGYFEQWVLGQTSQAPLEDWMLKGDE